MTAGVVSDRLLVTLWVGSLWAIGFIAVPAIFIHFDDVIVAGELAGRLFTLVNYIGLACGSALLLRYLFMGKERLNLWRFWVCLAMVLLVMFLHFYLQAEMSDIKMLDWRQDSVLSARFNLLHQLSTGVYSVLSLLGLALVVSQDSGVDHGEK